MAHTFTFISPKGGAGKTTLAIILAGELAHNDRKVVMIDADPNTPLKFWHAQGNAPDNIEVIIDSNTDGETIIENIEKAQEIAGRDGFVIIDTEGSANNRVTRAVGFADLVLIPFTSSMLDIQQTARAKRIVDDMAKMAQKTIPYALVSTRVEPAIVSREDVAALKAIKSQGFAVLDIPIFKRAAFLSMFRFGKTIHGLTNKNASGLIKARENTDAFMRSVMKFYGSAKQNKG